MFTVSVRCGLVCCLLGLLGVQKADAPRPRQTAGAKAVAADRPQAKDAGTQPPRFPARGSKSLDTSPQAEPPRQRPAAASQPRVKPPEEEEAPLAEDADDAEDEEPDEPAQPAKPGTAEWYVRETSRLRIEPPPEEDDQTRASQLLRARQLKIVELATKAVAQVHADRERGRVFEVAARHLLEARLQLAMLEDSIEGDQTQALYEEARAFFKRDPLSPSAAAGASALVNLAYHHASQSQDQAEEAGGWCREFAVQARHYLKSFPAEAVRSVPLAYTAGRLCEQRGELEDALRTFELVARLAPETEHGAEAEAIARRLQLPGTPPQISGTTLQGEPFVLDDLLGKPVLVVFWSTGNEAFGEALPRVLPAIRKARKSGLEVVGVCLDAEREAVEAFVQRHKLDWTQLYFADPEQQGWHNPITTHYGVFELPAWWLVDANGSTVSTTTSAEELPKAIARVLEAAGLVSPGEEPSRKEVVPVGGTQGKNGPGSGAKANRIGNQPAAEGPASQSKSAGKTLPRGK